MYFSEKSNYILGKYDSLENILIDDTEQKNYYQKWMGNYALLFKGSNELEIIEWRIREWRAIKEIYAAAIMYKEAEVAISHRCTSSYYFLMYYSLFHGLLSAICYDTNIKLAQIININHSKLGNLFRSTYCSGRYKIIADKIYEDFKKFKFLREYYSYTPPLNDSMYSEEHLISLDNHLSECFQLTNLHSLMFEKSYRKHAKDIRWTYDQIKYFRMWFMDAIAKKDIENNSKVNLDPADENILHETIRDGIGFQFIALQLDHTYDEFRLYDGASDFYSEIDGIGSSSIYSYIYDKII